MPVGGRSCIARIYVYTWRGRTLDPTGGRGCGATGVPLSWRQVLGLGVRSFAFPVLLLLGNFSPVSLAMHPYLQFLNTLLPLSFLADFPLCFDPLVHLTRSVGRYGPGVHICFCVASGTSRKTSSLLREGVGNAGGRVVTLCCFAFCAGSSFYLDIISGGAAVLLVGLVQCTLSLAPSVLFRVLRVFASMPCPRNTAEFLSETTLAGALNHIPLNGSILRPFDSHGCDLFQYRSRVCLFGTQAFLLLSRSLQSTRSLHNLRCFSYLSRAFTLLLLSLRSVDVYILLFHLVEVGDLHIASVQVATLKGYRRNKHSLGCPNYMADTYTCRYYPSS